MDYSREKDSGFLATVYSIVVCGTLSFVFSLYPDSRYTASHFHLQCALSLLLVMAAMARQLSPPLVLGCTVPCLLLSGLTSYQSLSYCLLGYPATTSSAFLLSLVVGVTTASLFYLQLTALSSFLSSLHVKIKPAEISDSL